MTRKRRPITVRPLRIPASKRLGEAARRLAKGFINDLREAAGRKPSNGGRGRRTERNPWPKCPTCFHRVPRLCPFCRRGRAGVTETHVQRCCPGACRRCQRCLTECPGRCSKCQECLDRCRGHDKEDQR